MTDEQLMRYARHIMLEGIGIAGQERLLNARVLVAGLGGLGSPVALYLASAGVGQLHLLDHDEVALSNLQRQILYRMQSVGQPKTYSAHTTLSSINPEIDLVLHDLKADTEEQWCSLIESVDLVLDCTDNFRTRHLINRACTTLLKPLISAAAIRYSGTLFMYNPHNPQSPCYHCLYPDSEAEGLQGDRCATLGVLAPLLGVMGSMQATLAINYLTQGKDLGNKFMLFDALNLHWQTLTVPMQACSVCHKR